MITAYLAAKDFTKELAKELTSEAPTVKERLFLTKTPPKPLIWAQNIWLNPIWIPITSINHGIKELRKIQKNWSLYSTNCHRRAQLIQEGLPKIQNTPLPFLFNKPTAPMGSWTLWEKNLILASPQSSHLLPNGEVEFLENKIDPPSRAYLKLWEAFSLYTTPPLKGQKCLDLGSSPGGWTWVLNEIGCKILSVDKAPITQQLMEQPNVTYLQKSAFSLTPEEIGPIDWLFSDVICYPERLLHLVKAWIDSKLCSNFVCTIKLQGPADYAAIEQFASIPNSKVLHLYHNKNEVTWICTQAKDLRD